ncbi:MAG: helix-hairpin-helix domain-containing protein [Syntrophales bacterium]|nr:helix-hairpin-helix domain-containing protein [Syntrophales bacterium]
MRKYQKILVLFIAALFLVSVVPMALAEEVEKININTASVEQLAKLKGVGTEFAQRVVEYRETNGPFAKAEDITKVKGIGSKTYEANKDIITVE